MTPTELFAAAGHALFGDEFIAPLAAALGIQKSTARKMAGGKSRIPPGIWKAVAELAEQRQRTALAWSTIRILATAKASTPEDGRR